jgi:ubiquinone/menaquinone biosynthesis C-methylase UbiE
MKQSRQQNFNQERQEHWDKVANKLENWTGWGSYYQKRVSQIYRFNIPPNQEVMEIGCGSGNLIASLKPSYGLGIDISGKMINRAKHLHPEINFTQSDAYHPQINRKFDFVIMSDTINDLWDVQTTLENIHKLLKQDGRLILNFFNRMWEFPLITAAFLNAAKPMLPQNWLTVEDTSNLLDLGGFEVLRHWEEVLMPLPIPLINSICNKFLVRFWPFYLFAMTHFAVARKKPNSEEKQSAEKVSVIVPARNEAGNIKDIFERVPKMGGETEIIFVEGHSTDNTLEEIKRQIKEHPSIPSSIFEQEGKGKGDAVRLGFSKAKGDILMILDADLTMPPEFLPRFYNGLVSGTGDFINGVRLVYPMEKQAMRLFNLIGNKIFSLVFSFLLGQPLKDTLCGTKVLWKKDYETIAKNRDYFGDFDPFGDFDLIFGAAKLNLKIVDMPIRYRERVYGETNIQRWRHGWLLIKMVLFAARRVKFI